MAKTVLPAIVLFILALGCISSQPQQNQSGNVSVVPRANVSPKGPITVTDEGPVQDIRIEASANNSVFMFPLKDYPGEFQSVGFYSDSFIVLNSSQIKFLDPQESVWLTPLVRGNRTMLFNAIYSRDMDTCTPSDVKVLGVDYAVGRLANGSSFGTDPKWKIRWDEQNGCRKRLIIYMDGYYADLQDGQIVPLFRDDNALLLKVIKTPDEQAMEIIATKPGG